MKRIVLAKEEKEIEQALVRGEYELSSQVDIQRIGEAIARRKKDMVLNIRVNSQDIREIKLKAKQLGVPYQTFISEILHSIAA